MHAAFLQAIIAEPDEDVHRLAYADWLEENGDEARASFIRVQCELAAPIMVTKAELLLETYPGQALQWARERVAPRLDALRKRSQELEIANWPRWAPPGFRFATRVDSTRDGEFLIMNVNDPAEERFDVRFRRGFIENVICSAADWLAHGDKVAKAAPVVRVRLTTWPRGTMTPMGQEWADLYCEWAATVDAVQHFDRPWEELVSLVLVWRFPGVTFELPPPPIGTAELNEALLTAPNYP